MIQQAIVVALQSDPKEIRAVHSWAEKLLKRHKHAPLLPVLRSERTNAKRVFLSKMQAILPKGTRLSLHNGDCVPVRCPARFMAFRILTEGLHNGGWLAVEGWPREDAEDAIVEVLHDLVGSEHIRTVAYRVVRAAYDRSTANVWKFLGMEQSRRRKTKSLPRK